MKKPIKVPKFKSEDEERSFWSKVDLSKHFERSDFKAVAFGDLKPTSRSISLRLPEYLLVRLKESANSLQVPYQTLIKQFIANGVLKK
ncbi:MAG: BrnA antitoxin family protein [bacterium]